MKKYEISKRVFYKDVEFPEESLIREAGTGYVFPRQSFDDPETARAVFEEKYRPKVKPGGQPGIYKQRMEIRYSVLAEVEYDEKGRRVSDGKFLAAAAGDRPDDWREEYMTRLLAISPCDAPIERTYEVVGYWKRNWDVDADGPTERYKPDEWRRYTGKVVKLIRFTDKSKLGLYGRVFALYGWNKEKESYRLCWEVDPDNLNETIDEEKTYIIFPDKDDIWGEVDDRGEFTDDNGPIDFSVFLRGSKFVVYQAVFSVRDDFSETLDRDKIREIFERHPSPEITELGRYDTYPEACDELDWANIRHERKGGIVKLGAAYIQEENVSGSVRTVIFSAPELPPK